MPRKETNMRRFLDAAMNPYNWAAALLSLLIVYKICQWVYGLL